MDYLLHVRRGIDYIEARLDAEIDLADVARHAGMSQWHFQRIFKGLTNETLKTYVRARRFAHALDKLAHTDERILAIAIAIASGFESQEAFTRAFKKAFGMPPASYRKSHRRVPFLRKLRIDEDYLRHLHGGVSLEPEVAVQPARSLVGMRTRFFSVDSEKNNFAAKLPALWASFTARMPEVAGTVAPIAYGVITQTPERGDELEYLAALETDASVGVPDGMVRYELPSARYATFLHRGDSRRLRSAAACRADVGRLRATAQNG